MAYINSLYKLPQESRQWLSAKFWGESPFLFPLTGEAWIWRV